MKMTVRAAACAFTGVLLLGSLLHAGEASLSAFQQEIGRRIHRSPKERAAALAELETLKASAIDPADVFRADCAIADVLLDYEFIPGMTREEVNTVRISAALEAAAHLRLIRARYPDRLDNAYYRYLELRAASARLHKNSSDKDRLVPLGLAKAVFKDWERIAPSVSPFPRGLEKTLYQAVHDEFRSVVVRELTDDLPSGTREHVIETAVLDRMRAAGAPEPFLFQQQREIVVVDAIAKGVDPNKKLSEQIDWPPTEQAEPVAPAQEQTAPAAAAAATVTATPSAPSPTASSMLFGPRLLILIGLALAALGTLVLLIKVLRG